MKVKIKKLHPDAVIPKYATNGASGFDLVAIEDYFIYFGETIVIKTGLAFEIPEGYEMQVRPRSGLSLKTDLRVSNSPGTVDADYRGEVGIIISNTGKENGVHIGTSIKKGDRIAQGVICPIIQADLELVDDLTDTQRGEGAFGSTGV